MEAEQSSISLTMKELAERIMRRVIRWALAFRALRTISNVIGSMREAVSGSAGCWRVRREWSCITFFPIGQRRLRRCCDTPEHSSYRSEEHTSELQSLMRTPN